jgi:hypothetical protein
MGWLAPRPDRFTPGKETAYPFYGRLGGPQGRSGRLRKIWPPPGFDHRTVQPVVSRYTDCAIPAHCAVYLSYILLIFCYNRSGLAYCVYVLKLQSFLSIFQCITLCSLLGQCIRMYKKFMFVRMVELLR